MTEDNKSLQMPLTGQEEWAQIANRIYEELGGKELPDKVLQATELLLVGTPIHKVAKQLKVTPQTIRGWLSQFPTMSAVVADGRKLLSKWRMAKLEQQFLTAIDRSQEILEIGLDGTTPSGEEVNAKVLTVIAAQARYVIGLFASQAPTNVNVKHELGDTVLQARKDALDYLTQQLKGQEDRVALGEPIEVTYRVIDPKMDNTGPMLSEEGGAPFGEIGVLHNNEDGILCQVCGGRFKSLARHLSTKHNMTSSEYEVLYLLPEGEVRREEGYSDDAE